MEVINMTRKEKMDYLLARLPEGKKEEFMSEFRGAVSDEARSDVVKKYCTVYAPGIMDDCIEDLIELTMDDMDAVAGGKWEHDEEGSAICSCYRG